MLRNATRLSYLFALALAPACDMHTSAVAPRLMAASAGAPPTAGRCAVAPSTPLVARGTAQQQTVQRSAARPISGGTLLTTRDHKLVVASDPDRDRLYFVDVSSQALLHVRTLQSGDEPGRLIEDADGRIHVVLRSGHALATLTREPDSAIVRRGVCDLPRGVAYDAAQDLVHVACAEGKLVSVSAAPDGGLTRELAIERDARDVVVRGDDIFVSRFRSAELQVIHADGSLGPRIVPPSAMRTANPSLGICNQPGVLEPGTVETVPTVAWRMIDVPGQGIAMLHERARTGEVQITAGGYGSGTCGSGIVSSALSVGLDSDSVASNDLPSLPLAVDFAAAPDGQTLVVASAGTSGPTAVQSVSLAPDSLFRKLALPASSPRAPASGPIVAQPSGCLATSSMPRSAATSSLQVSAVTWVDPSLLALQFLEPAGIEFVRTAPNTGSSVVMFDQESRADTGRSLFHTSTRAGLACASCHPEAGDDGHVWTFASIGPRRTQSLRGGLSGTEPFHWNGDMIDFQMLVHEVLVGRMSASIEPTPDQDTALIQWLDQQPALHAQPADEAAAERGKHLFESDAVGCNNCHSGPHLTNNRNEDVGTGARVQVPSLHGVAFRTPLLHNGCAKTLLDRFGSCGGGDKHGHTSQLDTSELADLVAYLETL